MRKADLGQKAQSAYSPKTKKKKKNTYSDGKNELATTFILLPTVFKPLATKFIASYNLATGFSYEKASRSYFNFSKFEIFRISQIKRNEVQTHLFLPPDHESKLGFHIWGLIFKIRTNQVKNSKNVKMAKRITDQIKAKRLTRKH